MSPLEYIVKKIGKLVPSIKTISNKSLNNYKYLVNDIFEDLTFIVGRVDDNILDENPNKIKNKKIILYSDSTVYQNENQESLITLFCTSS